MTTEYREVVPEVGQPVPQGCQWAAPAHSDYWISETAPVWGVADRMLFDDGYRWRVIADSPSSHWLNTLSLD